ncbi:MAG: hypothetical protein J6I96_01225 [Oscillospiraceae bacterium]|nr:hypothetical protein [Oscillospiraceae bacterium]
MRKKKKIFRPRRRYRIKKKNENAAKIVISVVALAVLVFVGYSAMGPITEYIERSRNAETEPWTPPSQTDVPPEETPDTPSQTAGTTAVEPEQTEQTVISAVPRNVHSGRAIMLEDGASADMQTLSLALDNAAADGCGAVIVPLKTEGGVYRYKSELEAVSMCETSPVRSELTAKEICSAITSRGLVPVAYVSVLTDNNRYGADRIGAYRSSDGKVWVDGNPALGGKPWISPFEESGVTLLCDTMTEIGSAGFSRIICGDFVFPEFEERDLAMLSGVSSADERSAAVTTLAKRMTNAARGAGSDIMIRATAEEVIRGSELFVPDKLGGCTVVIDCGDASRVKSVAGNDISTLDAAHKTTAVYTEALRHADGLECYPMFRYTVNADRVAEAFSDIGCESCYVY